MSVCKICDKEFGTEKGLSYHISQAHKMSLEEYYLAYICENVESAGKCIICGKQTPFLSRLDGYQKTCSSVCGGIAGSDQGHLTTLKRYGKKALNNPEKNKQYYLEHPEAKKIAIANSVSARKENNSYVLGGYKAKITREMNIKQFLSLNDCVLPYTLVHKYGQGWYKAQENILNEDDYVYTDQLGKITTYCIKKSAIPKIEKYFNETAFSQTSYGEKSVLNFAESIYDGEIVENTRNIISPYELDIYFPAAKVAIEYNGTYWHSIQGGANKTQHYLKSFLCEQLGIRLIHVYEYEWNDTAKQKILKSIIKNALGLNSNRVYARKCEVRELSKKDVEQFSNQNSLHGHRNASIYLGLYYNDELLEIMTFGKAFFARDSSIDFECIRSITKLDTTVVGGMNKLFKYFVNKWHPNKVLYYVDYNTHIGNSMEKLGFKFIKYSKHGIRNVVKNPTKDVDIVLKYGKVFNRKPGSHSEIEKLIEDGKVFAIYDAGVKKYIWTATNSD